MRTKTLSNDFMQGIADEDAWKELSCELNWSETLLEKYQDKIDWQELSENRHTLWTIPMIQKFKNRINWDKFSRYAEEQILTESCIDAFKDKWNWTELSNNENLNLTDDLLMKYADKWNWEKIIDRYRDKLFLNKGIEFFERYKDYIPAAKLQNSSLWTEIIHQRKEQILLEITA